MLFHSSFAQTTLSTYRIFAPSQTPQTPPPTARLLVNVYKQGTTEKLVVFSQNVSAEGQNKWEELNIGLTANQAVDIEVICENTSTTTVFFDEISVKVQSVPTTILVQENHYMPFGLGMRGLDWVQTPSKENKYQYNGGVEKNTDFDLNWYETFYRSLDVQTGRFLQVDPLAEDGNQETLTPYHYAFNNPIRYNDPKGDCPDCLEAIGDFFNGFANAVAHNATTAPNGAEIMQRGSGSTSYTVGQKFGDAFSVVQGAAETAAGMVLATSGATITVGSLGTATLVGAPAMAVGGVATAHGATTTMNGAGMLFAKKTPVKPYEVGSFDELKNRSNTGDGLDIHHTPQKHPAGQVNSNYNKDKGVSIALPSKEHKKIPKETGTTNLTFRQLVAKAAFQLRKFTNATNDKIQELINANKKEFPNEMKK